MGESIKSKSITVTSSQEYVNGRSIIKMSGEVWRVGSDQGDHFKKGRISQLSLEDTICNLKITYTYKEVQRFKQGKVDLK